MHEDIKAIISDPLIRTMTHSEHLLFALGLVTTGPDYETDEIVEMAATVVLPHSLVEERIDADLNFHCNIRPTKAAAPVSTNGKKQAEMELDEVDERPNFSEAFKQFMDWVQSVVRPSRRLSTDYLITGLVAHRGNWCDFRFLVKETERHFPANIDDVIGLWFQLTDCWEFVWRLKRTGAIDSNLKTDLGDLHKTFFNENCDLSSAVQKAETIARLLTTSPLQSYWNHMDFLTFPSFKVWLQKEQKNRLHLDDLITNFGWDLVSMDLMQTLAYERVTYQELNNVYWRTRNSTTFRMKVKNGLHLHLTAEEAHELYAACAATRTCCSCFRSCFGKGPWKKKCQTKRSQSEQRVVEDEKI